MLGQEGGAALEAQQGHRYPPAVVDLAEDQVRLRLGAVEEDFVELGLAGELADGAHLDAGLLEWAQQEAQAAVAGCVRISADQDEDPVGELGEARPHLLPVDDPGFAVADGSGLDVGEI